MIPARIAALRLLPPLPHQHCGPGAGDIHRHPRKLRKLCQHPAAHQLLLNAGGVGPRLHPAGSQGAEDLPLAQALAALHPDLPDEKLGDQQQRKHPAKSRRQGPAPAQTAQPRPAAPEGDQLRFKAQPLGDLPEPGQMLLPDLQTQRQLVLRLQALQPQPLAPAALQQSRPLCAPEAEPRQSPHSVPKPHSRSTPSIPGREASPPGPGGSPPWPGS